jgi:cytochrome c2
MVLISMSGYAGGPPILTTTSMPEFFVVGKPELLQFVVRAICCDNGYLDSRSYSVRAREAGGREITMPAIPAGKNGEYWVELTLPARGDWTITVDFSYGTILSTPLYRKAILPGSRPPVPLSLEARGRRDFSEKGCVSCHVNREVTQESYALIGPDLTGQKFRDEYFSKFLANPAGVKPGTNMPNLNLTREDIAELAAFFSRERQSAN